MKKMIALSATSILLLAGWVLAQGPGVIGSWDINFKMTAKVQGQDMVFAYTGKIDKDSMKGDVDFGGFAQGTWSAVPHKEGAAPSTPAPQSGGGSNMTGTWDFQ